MTERPPKSRKLIRILALLFLGIGLILLIVRSSDRDPMAPVATLGALPISTIVIPVLYTPVELIDELELQVPVLLGGLAARQSYPMDPRFQYAFEAEREPFQVEVRGDTVRLTTVVRYGGQVWYDTPLGIELTASCGVLEGKTAVDAPRATVVLSSLIEIDEDWHLRSNVMVEAVQPLTQNDRCRISVFQFQLDATEPIMTEVRRWLQSQATLIDSALAAVSLRSSIEKSWAVIQDPIALSPDTWLALRPLELGYRVDQNSGSARQPIRGEIKITVQPQIVVGRRPDISYRPLPPLGSDSDGGDPWIVVEARVEYGTLSEIASAVVVGRRFQIAGRTIEIRSVKLSGSNDGRVVAEFEVEGELLARVHLMGTPVFDASTDQIRFPDLQFSIETDDILARVAGWLLSTGLPNFLRRRARLPVNETLAEGRELMQELNFQLSDEARLEARLDALEITELAATEGGLVVRSRVLPEGLLLIGDTRVR